MQRFIIGLAFGLSLLPGWPTQAQTPQPNLNAKRPAPPRRLPPNNSKPGGGLDPSAQSCGATQYPLTALIPTQNPVLTATPHPTFLIYVPDQPQDIQTATFSILSADSKQRLYQTTVPLTAPGIVKIQLPQTPQMALEQDKSYHWHFDLDCQPGRVTERLNVNGWVTRVAAASNALLWYDALADLSQTLQSEPGNVEVRDRWLSLLKSAGLENLPQATTFTPQVQN
ncbi:MAG: DUF928 domain-containing protein [Thermosynechococcaceae cyanobacterium]